jgi:hypothetical protein
MQRHVPSPQRRDTHRKALEVPLNLLKARHWCCWVYYNWFCHNWGAATTSWHWYVHRTHCSLVCTLKAKHLLDALLHTQKNKIHQKHKK